MIIVEVVDFDLCEIGSQSSELFHFVVHVVGLRYTTSQRACYFGGFFKASFSTKPTNAMIREMIEIVDLRRALECLITRRGVEEVLCNKLETSPQDVSGRLLEDEELIAIPNLVNRVLLEHYSSNSTTNGGPRVENRNWTKHQKSTVTQLLLAVIIEFSEPYFIRMTLREEQERLLLLHQQRNNENKMTTMTTNNNGASKQNCSSLDKDVKFDKRAVAWATSCIHQLLQQPQKSVVVDLSKTTGDKNSNDDDNDDYVINELDALLAASGTHDGKPMQERIQCALMNGLNGRRLLRRNFS